MKPKALLLSLCWVLFSFTLLTAQHELRSSGQLPDEVTQSIEEKIARTLANGNTQAPTPDELNFLKASTYFFDQMLRSGYVLYNDPAGDYVNKVLQVVLDANPSLADKQPHAYVLQSTEVNAFAIDQGIIFVSLGLLAQLENEAQLAFVLSHELVHIEKAHALDGFVEDARIDRSRIRENNDRGNLSREEFKDLMKNQYSRTQEMEADELGLSYYLNTNYDLNTVLNVFEILRYAHLPFDDIAFDPAFLERYDFVFPPEARLDTVQTITVPEEDDTNSTHPAIDKRLTATREQLAGVDYAEREAYLVSQEEFVAIQRLARISLPHYHLLNQELPEAIYAAYLVAQHYPDQQAYAEDITARALYGLAKFRNAGERSTLPSPNWKKVEGEAQQSAHILSWLKASQLNTLALTYQYDLYQRQAADTATLRTMMVDLFADMILELKEDPAEIYPEAIIVKGPPVVTDNMGETSDETTADEHWHEAAFLPVVNDPSWQSIMQEGRAFGQDRQAESDYYDRATYDGRRHLRQYEKERERNGASLGIDKILVYQPTYVHVNATNLKPKMDLELSSEQTVLISDILAQCESLLDIDIQLLNAKALQNTQADVLNDLFTLDHYISNQLDPNTFIYHPYDPAALTDIMERYDTRYLATIYAISGHPNFRKPFLFNLGESFLFVAVFDMQTGRQSFIKTEYLNRYLNKAMLQSELYDAFYQISKSN